MIASLETRRGFSFDNLIKDKPENLRGILNGVIRTVREDRRKARLGEPRMTHPYNPLACALSPEFWYYSGFPTEYYEQRIAIYQDVLRLVDAARGKFFSTDIAEFVERIEGYIPQCERLKQGLERAQEFSRIVEAAYAKRMRPSELFIGCCRVVLQT